MSSDDTARMLATPLGRHLERLAESSEIVVATDFDGTLSPIAPQPDAARPHPRAGVILDELAHLPRTHVAVITGRSIDDLVAVAQLPSSIELVGSHGLELSSGATFGLDGPALLRLHRIAADLDLLAATVPGSRVERKPFSVAFHYRNAEREPAADALRRIEDEITTRDGVWCKPGHEVVEVLVLPASKSWAIDLLRSRYPGAPVFYSGDDLTDEDVFADLQPGDLGCKVGPGETIAEHRVADPDAVITLLETLTVLRSAALAPVERHQ